MHDFLVLIYYIYLYIEILGLTLIKHISIMCFIERLGYINNPSPRVGISFFVSSSLIFREVFLWQIKITKT